MKFIITSIIILSSLITSAQELAGVYEYKAESESFKLIRTLTLNNDNTFEYSNYRYIEKGIPKETQSYGKGTWTKDKNIISFFTGTADISDKYTYNFNETKARFDTKSPRDKTDRIIETSIRFFESELRILKGLTLIKK